MARLIERDEMAQFKYTRNSIVTFLMIIVVGIYQSPSVSARDSKLIANSASASGRPHSISNTGRKTKIKVSRVDSITINGMTIPVGKRKMKLTGVGSGSIQSSTRDGKKSVNVVLQGVPPSTQTQAPPRAVSEPHSVPSSVRASLGDAISDLRRRSLSVPIAGYSPKLMQGSFYQSRGSSRLHSAVDMLAPRNTPILAVESGTIGRLFTSKAGGITIYQKSPDGKFVYYYAHLERYADNLHDGAPVARNQVIGYVGTSGNAPPNTPHLHFAISKIDGSSVFHGTPIDPFEVYSK